MEERTGMVTFKGAPLTLLGPRIKVGDPAPDFSALANDLSPVALSDYEGKVVILSSVPSLDTPVCDSQTRRFNEEAAALSDDIVILTVSMDLPFAQKRWCAAAGIDKVQTISDHRDASFGRAYGLLVKELRLLARAVIVVDKAGDIVYAQIVDEIGKAPDYAPAIAAAKKLL
ncbi:MAG: thiol peroxidase [Phycisphaerae bacterium]|nr:thiol peroxidase [Phycisphaerae bacterium]